MFRYIALFLIILLQTTAQASERLALVIGNGDYQKPVPSLTNPVGLAEMKSPTGSLIAYATAPDSASYGDTSQRNSIYTKYLLEALRDMSHISVLDMLTEVTKKVVAKTKGLQVPWKSDSLTQRFCFSTCGQVTMLPSRQSEAAKVYRDRLHNAIKLSSFIYYGIQLSSLRDEFRGVLPTLGGTLRRDLPPVGNFQSIVSGNEAGFCEVQSA